MAHREFIVPLSIAADVYLHMYSGAAQNVVARDSEGRRVQFPAASLRPFVTREGVKGVFIIRVDENNRLLDIRRQGG